MIKELGEWFIDHTGSDWYWDSATTLFNGDANQGLDLVELIEKVHSLTTKENEKGMVLGHKAFEKIHAVHEAEKDIKE